MQIMDVFGDPAAQFHLIEFIVTTNLLDRIAQEGMLSPVMEKTRLLGDVYGRRPGDVTIPVWRANKGLAIDVAVTCSLASSNLHHKEPCEDYAASHKHAY